MDALAIGSFLLLETENPSRARMAESLLVP